MLPPTCRMKILAFSSMMFRAYPIHPNFNFQAYFPNPILNPFLLDPLYIPVT